MEHDHNLLTFGQNAQCTYFQTLDHIVGRGRGFKWTRNQRTKYYNKLYAHLKTKGKGRILEVERVKGMSKQDFHQNYILKNKPVIMEGAAKDWHSVQNWDIDYFIKEYGDDQILVVGNGYSDEKGKRSADNYPSTLAKELTDIKNGGSNYYRFYPLFHWHPERLADIDYEFLNHYANKRGYNKLLQTFIGGPETYTSYHNSCASNLFTQIVGEKEWYLISNDYLPIIDPSPTLSGLNRGAPVRKKEGCFNPFFPDFSPPYHLYEFIDQYHLVLQPGDIFYNPPYYWHAVKNKSFSIGVGFRWFSPSAIIRSSKLFTVLDTFSPLWFNLNKTKTGINQVLKDEAKK